MVWLHGRFFSQGAGSEGWYNGANLALRGDVVVVTINHRLNGFGYLHLGDIAGPDFAASGVAGMLDCVLALKWIKENIANFGGNPGNVTIFGESGGGRKVSLLLAMPAAKGLFHRAIMQSGVTIRAIEPSKGTELAERLLKYLGMKDREVEKLQSLPHETLTAALGEVLRAADQDAGYHPVGYPTGMQLAPVLDGTHLPHHPFDGTAPPTALDVPVLIGTTKDESAISLARDPRRLVLTEDELVERLNQMLGARTSQILRAYKRNRPGATPWDLLIAVTSEGRRLSSIHVADQILRAGGGPVFMYLFAWESDYQGGLFKACHALDVPFVFDNVDVVPLTGDRRDKFELAATIADYWAAFARNGDPNMGDLPRWPVYEINTRPTMILDMPCRAKEDPASDERLAWNGEMVYP
jgi:para-nitrobenzyl esterase